METLFTFIIIVLSIFNFTIPKTHIDITVIENKSKIQSLASKYNQTNPELKIRLFKSVGNHGRYKNIGFDYELLHRKNKYPNKYEYKKGLRRYNGQDFAFIYLENGYTLAFIEFLKSES